MRSIDVARAALGWGTFVVLRVVGDPFAAPVPAGTLIVALAVIIGVIVVCAFGVVVQAEALARRLGDPYGSLVLTLSIVLIEVVLIAAVMIGPGVHLTIGRDSVMAVSMIILNLVIGLSIVLGRRRHQHLEVNRRGAVSYLTMITLLGAVGFAVPRWIGVRGVYADPQAASVIGGAVVAYAVFLYRQMGPRAGDYRQVDPSTTRIVDLVSDDVSIASGSTSIRQTVTRYRSEVTTRLIVLVITMIPIVLLSHDMATLLDDGLGRLGAPTTLAGALIAVVVFLPEGLTAVRAALAGEMQRVSNLCHGALVSTFALTIPAVLAIGLVTGKDVVLAASSTDLALLAVTLVLSWVTFTGRRVTTAHGVTHLVVVAIYCVTLFV